MSGVCPPLCAGDRKAWEVNFDHLDMNPVKSVCVTPNGAYIIVCRETSVEAYNTHDGSLAKLLFSEDRQPDDSAWVPHPIIGGAACDPSNGNVYFIEVSGGTIFLLNSKLMYQDVGCFPFLLHARCMKIFNGKAHFGMREDSEVTHIVADLGSQRVLNNIVGINFIDDVCRVSIEMKKEDQNYLLLNNTGDALMTYKPEARSKMGVLPVSRVQLPFRGAKSARVALSGELLVVSDHEIAVFDKGDYSRQIGTMGRFSANENVRDSWICSSTMRNNPISDVGFVGGTGNIVVARSYSLAMYA